MSITVTHEPDGTISVRCGTQSITIEIDGRPVVTPQPIKLKPIRGKGAGHAALDIPRQTKSSAEHDEMELLPDQAIDLDDFLEADGEELEMER